MSLGSRLYTYRTLAWLKPPITSLTKTHWTFSSNHVYVQVPMYINLYILYYMVRHWTLACSILAWVFINTMPLWDILNTKTMVIRVKKKQKEGTGNSSYTCNQPNCCLSEQCHTSNMKHATYPLQILLTSLNANADNTGISHIQI